MSNSSDSNASPDPASVAVDEKQIQSWVDPDQPQASVDRLKSWKLKVKSTGNPYLLAHLLSYLGRLQSQLRRFEEARETLNEADFVLIEAAQRDTHESPVRHRAWVRYMVERARFFHYTGWEPSARSTLENAVDMARATGHFDLFQEATRLQAELDFLPEQHAGPIQHAE
jgi:hypothetical protein